MKIKRNTRDLSPYIYPLEYINRKRLEKKIIKENGNEEENYQVCSHFGCGKRLRLEEILAGGRCHEHTDKKRK